MRWRPCAWAGSEAENRLWRKSFTASALRASRCARRASTVAATRPPTSERITTAAADVTTRCRRKNFERR